MLGVDTPETHHPTKPVQCYGPEASDWTRVRLLGQPVKLERDAETRDIYSRLLMYVSLDGERFNDELLRLGYARLLVIPPNGAHARAMLAEELVDCRFVRAESVLEWRRRPERLNAETLAFLDACWGTGEQDYAVDA